MPAIQLSKFWGPRQVAAQMQEWYRTEGTPHNCGATWIDEERAYNFTLYSRAATAVTLLFYSEDDMFNPMARIALDYLKNKSGRIWHCRVPISQIVNARYYAYSVDGPSEPQNGERFDAQNVRKLILDSMRFWMREMHVDGFRFDLASIFTRRDDGSIDLDQPAVIADISGDQDFADIRLIAEPWDPRSYELGRSFPGHMWGQWNGEFRDDVRSFIKGDNGKVGALMSRIYGSDELFPDVRAEAYHPFQSVNLITCHDGFCLYDLVAYNSKHNEANGHNNQDGTDNNLSWTWTSPTARTRWPFAYAVPPSTTRTST